MGLASRMSHKKRLQIWNKTNGKCAYCPREFQSDFDPHYTIDHIKPKCLGGTNTITNLIPCCRKCNEKKDDVWVDNYTLILHSVSLNYLSRHFYSRGTKIDTYNVITFFKDSNRSIKLFEVYEKHYRGYTIKTFHFNGKQFISDMPYKNLNDFEKDIKKYIGKVPPKRKEFRKISTVNL